MYVPILLESTLFSSSTSFFLLSSSSPSYCVSFSSYFSCCALMFSPPGICVCICVSAPRRIAETKNGSFYPPCFPISPTVRPNPPFSKCCSQMFGKSCPLNLSSNSLETSSQTRTCLRPSALLPFPSLQIIQTPLHSIIVLEYLKYMSTIRHTFLHMCLSQQFLCLIPLHLFFIFLARF